MHVLFSLDPLASLPIPLTSLTGGTGQNQLACLSDFGHTMGPSLSPEIRSDQCFIRVFTLDFEFVYVSTGMLHFYSYNV